MKTCTIAVESEPYGGILGNGFHFSGRAPVKTPASTTGINHLLSSVMGDICGQDTSYLTNETFHTPSFDDDFDITSLNLPQVTDNLPRLNSDFSAQQQLNYSSYGNIDYNLFTSHQPIVSNGPPLNTLTSTLAPIFPPQNFEIPDISLTNNFSSGVNSLTSMAMMTSSIDSSNQNGSYSPTTSSHVVPSVGDNSQQISPANSAMTGTSPRESSEDSSDDCLPLAQLMKRQAAAKAASEEQKVPSPPPTGVTKTRKTPKKKKKKDPNEPQKPVSAYALFFRDTQAAIKGQNPAASFGEVSKIVASMWDGLEPDAKSVYKKKTEMAKKEYLKQLAAYRASLVSQLPVDDNSPFSNVMMEKPKLTKGHMAQTSPIHGSPNLSPSHQGTWPLHNRSPQNMGMSPQGHSPENHGMSPQNMNMSPQKQGLSPIHHQGDIVMGPPSQSPPQMGYGSPQHMGHTSPQHIGHTSPQQIVSSPPRSLQPIAPRQPVLGQLMEEANICLDGGDMMQSMCIRNGCTNPTIESPGWDNEYCSNECVVNHCRDVFTAWVSSHQGSNQFTVK